jgi:exopolysaccharide biosynthesis protein
MKLKLSRKLPLTKKYIASAISIVILAASLALSAFFYLQKNAISSQNLSLSEKLASTQKELEELKNQDQVKINNDLEAEIENINKIYRSAVSIYENLLDLKLKSKDTSEFEKTFASSLNLLSERNYQEADLQLVDLDAKITQALEESIQTQTAQITTVNTPQSNTPPDSGYSRQVVSSDAGNFTVSIVSADYSTTKVIVDTASDSTCNNDCPVLPLATYVSRNGAYAAVNGSYFCPASYPSCAGKSNTFDLLLMNKNKAYFNSDNNVYSSNPGVVFGGGYVRFLNSVSDWGRDTSIDSMISNYPMLIWNKSIAFGGDNDPKKGSKGNRSFVALKGNTIYIGVVHSATVAESARVMSALGMDYALNLDDGGSTALWSGGYKVGPGRDLPNAILFVGK